MRLTGPPWTLGEDDALRNAVIAGASLPALSKALGRSESALRSRAYVLRLSLRPGSQGQRLLALPQSAIAKEAGLKAKSK